MKTRRPAEVFHPGEFIEEELDARGWTKGDLARIMGCPKPDLAAVISQKKGITIRTALQLSAAFGTSPEFWLNLDNSYNLSKARVPLVAIEKRAANFAKTKLPPKATALN